jgi:hypothetical protein
MTKQSGRQKVYKAETQPVCDGRPLMSVEGVCNGFARWILLGIIIWSLRFEIGEVLLDRVVARTSTKFYKPSEVTEISVERACDTLVIQFRLPMESLYYCPGVNARSEDGTLVVTVVRDYVKARTRVMYPDKSRQSGRVRVSVPDLGIRQVVLAGGDERRTIWKNEE